MKPKIVKVYAPATIANVGAGFDVLGIAIDAPGDIVIAKRIPEPELIFSLRQRTPNVPAHSKNVAAHVAQLLLDEARPPFGVALTLFKKMPVGSGLGSSGASCAAAVFAVNALLPKPLSKMDLLPFAVEGERLASGAPHADNVAPSLLGGVCLIQSYQPLSVIKLPVKNVFYWIVAHPHCIVETKKARHILPTSLPLSVTTSQLGCLGGLITGLITGDKPLTGRSIQDFIAEPARAKLIPGFAAAKQAAFAAGALGYSISGSGPSVFALAASLKEAKQIARAIQTAFKQQAKLKCDIYISKINQNGTTLTG